MPPHVRCFPRTFCAWPCLLRQVGTVLGSPCDCIVTGITYANPGSRHYDTSRVFMDGGSSMNIIFSHTVNQMSIPRSVWKKSRVTLYGVVPERAASSLGKIRLEVVFGEKGNYRTEVIEFKIVD